MKQRLSSLLVVGVVVAVYLLGGFAPLERGLTSLRFRLLAQDATGQIVVVGIDSQSLRTLNTWPWPREYHGQLVDRLVEAGADRIALDIDFSSSSNADSDARFAEALARAGEHVVMATFKQPVRDENGVQIFVQTAPIPALARHTRLGHVNVQVAADSLVWQYSNFEDLGEFRLPGMATLMAGQEQRASETFGIDYAIRPETLPYISYSDILEGRFDPAWVAGRTVIVGATALELGDRIPVPVHSVLPGPIVQALIAETMIQERGLHRLSEWLVATIALLLGAMMAPLVRKSSWQRGALAVAGVAVSVSAMSLVGQALWPVTIDVSPIVLTPVGLFLANLVRSIDRLGSMFRRERLESLYRRAMMSAVVDSSFDGIAIADGDGNLELINPSALRVLDCDEKAVLGRPIHDTLPWSEEIAPIYQEDETGAKHATVVGPLELGFDRQDETITIEMIVTSARLNLNRSSRGGEGEQRIVYIYMFRDITDRKRVEEAQRLATEEANAANRAKTEFLHNMSHELRTPLNAIIGFSDIVRNEMMGPVGVPQYLEYIRDINNSGQHLLQVVNDILDMSKIESGQIELSESEVYLPHVIQASVRLVEERSRQAEQVVQIAAPSGVPEIKGDERLIKQMLLNLLSNAVKFTPAGGTITVEAECLPDGEVALHVRDTGIGIDAKDFDRIMEPFGQADASLAREYEGTGLGLPLVKSMIELHGGRIAVESEVGIGSTFTLYFPAERRVPARPAKPQVAVA